MPITAHRLLPPAPATAYDVIIVGGGPAGASCAAFCARAGLRTLVVERAIFPRDKVCGDCLNPACWPVLERLAVADAVRALPHTALREVEFVGLRGRPIRLPLPDDPIGGEIAVRRRDLDALLLDHAAALGAEVRHGWAVSDLRMTDHARALDGCEVTISKAADQCPSREKITTRVLVGADGRNSVVARLAGMPPPKSRGANREDRGRIGLQTHVPCPPGFGQKVQMRWFADGYGGLCPVGHGELNISLAAPAQAIDRLKRWAQTEFSLPANHPWQTIAPVDRAPVDDPASTMGDVFLVGDAARVVEPFTGEGIYYALRSGELAAQSIIAAMQPAPAPAGPDSSVEESADAYTHHGLSGTSTAILAGEYCRAHADLYRGRLWVNRLARAAGRHPRLASWALTALRWRPELLGHLTAKVVRTARPPGGPS